MSPDLPRVATPLEVLSHTRLLPAISPLKEDAVTEWADACVASGVRALELLLRGEGAEAAAFTAIARLARSHPQLAVGVGTVFDAHTAQRAIDAGARIVVSPIVDVATGAVCQAANVDWLPGAFTPTEIALAERTGAQQVKLFPALAIDAPAFLRSVLATRPNARIVPTNVALDEIPALVAAGAAGFGVGERLMQGATGTAAIENRLREAMRAADGASIGA